MTVLFASDLDQTLIYSRNSMGMEVTEEELVEVERYEGKPLSFMTKKSQSALWHINASAFFLPVTTRTQAQYERVTGIFEGQQAPRFAIVSNGAVILENGKPVKEWSEKIRQQCSSRKTIISELLPEIERHFSEDWVLKVKEAEEWFVYLIVDRARFPEDKLNFYTAVFKELGWGMSLQGRKLYFMPESITKAAATEYIKERIGASYVLAAGDSLLDLDLLESANYGMVASHGEAVKSAVSISRHIHKTDKHGIKVGEEILARVAEISLQRQ